MTAKQQKPALMILPFALGIKLSRPLFPLSMKIARYFPYMKENLKAVDWKVEDYEYIAVSLLNILFIGFAFFGLLFLLSYVTLNEVKSSLRTAGLYSLIIPILFGYVLFSYPKINAVKRAEDIDKNLVYAIRDLLLQVSSGVPLYNGLINVAQSGYGTISDEFVKVAKSIKTGKPMHIALEKMAINTKSEYLKRTTWQIINSIKAGSSLKTALKIIVKDLTLDQRTKIRDYAQELNLWNLIYMLFAVAVPTIGSVMLIILSSFAGLGISKVSFILFIVLCFFIQYVIIGFIKARRPVVQF